MMTPPVAMRYHSDAFADSSGTTSTSAVSRMTLVVPSIVSALTICLASDSSCGGTTSLFGMIFSGLPSSLTSDIIEARAAA